MPALLRRGLPLAVVALTALPAAADRWLPFEALHAEAIDACGPTKGKIENESLTTYNWPRGVITFKSDGPGAQLEDGGLAMKFHWERKVAGPLTISGRRLDGEAPPLRSSIPDGYGTDGFQTSAVIFGGPGCWEVTGSVGKDDLVFRVFVIKAPPTLDVATPSDG